MLRMLDMLVIAIMFNSGRRLKPEFERFKIKFEIKFEIPKMSKKSECLLELLPSLGRGCQGC